MEEKILDFFEEVRKATASIPKNPPVVLKEANIIGIKLNSEMIDKLTKYSYPYSATEIDYNNAFLMGTKVYLDETITRPKYIIEGEIIDFQQKELYVGGRIPNKEVLYLKQSIEQCNDKPIFYMSKNFGNKYIVPQKEYEKLNKEHAKYKEVLRIIFEKNVDIDEIKNCKTVIEYNWNTKFERYQCKELTQDEFDLVKEWNENVGN